MEQKLWSKNYGAKIVKKKYLIQICYIKKYFFLQVNVLWQEREQCIQDIDDDT
jgi:hypothetical protein